MEGGRSKPEKGRLCPLIPMDPIMDPIMNQIGRDGKDGGERGKKIKTLPLPSIPPGSFPFHVDMEPSHTHMQSLKQDSKQKFEAVQIMFCPIPLYCIAM